MKPQILLIIDDEPSILKSLKRELGQSNRDILTADSAEEALSILSSSDPHVIISDRMMPGMDGVSFLEVVREKKPDAIRLMITGHATVNSAVDAVNRGKLFGFLLKPWDSDILKQTISSAFSHYQLAEENRRLARITHEQNIELKALNDSLELRVKKRTQLLSEAVRESVTMLATAAETKDKDTGDHIYRVKNLVRAICQKMGLPPKQTEAISLFSMLHDVGKIHIPDAILNYPGKLTSEQWQVMQSHTTAGEHILGASSFFRTARQIARSHHENWDGSGYPDSLRENEIPLPARVVSVVDVFDALTHARPYKQAWSKDQALKEMALMAGSKFEPKILLAFFDLMDYRP